MRHLEGRFVPERRNRLVGHAIAKENNGLVRLFHTTCTLSKLRRLRSLNCHDSQNELEFYPIRGVPRKKQLSALHGCAWFGPAVDRPDVRRDLEFRHLVWSMPSPEGASSS